MMLRTGSGWLVFLGCLTLAECLFGNTPATSGSVSYDGRASHAVVSDSTSFQLEQFTVAAWVKFNHVGNSQVILNRGGAGELFTLYLYHGHIRMLVEQAPEKYAHADSPGPKAGVWTHYAGTFDGHHISLYVDGKLTETVPAEGRIKSSTAKLYIGCLQPGSRTLDGHLQDPAVWSRVLPSKTIETLAQQRGGPLPQESLVACWRDRSTQNATWLSVTGHSTNAVYHNRLTLAARTADGYRGIWYSNTAQDDKYVYKYSGGLGTYCAKHRPVAVYAKQANKTFFCYGGTTRDNSTLLHMVSYFDHKTHTVPKPTVLLDKQTTDAHDNPVIALDNQGFIWIFSASHGTARPSFISKSKRPYDIREFEHILTTNFSYPQPYYLAGHGFIFLHTRYGGGRRLYETTSRDGRTWTPPQLLAAVEQGHYQISWTDGKKIGTAFNLHPGGRGLDWRTNLYYMETRDFGRSWQDAGGKPIPLPLHDAANRALVRNYIDQKQNVYMKDLAFDKAGHPVILFVTSKGWRSGPENGPRLWQTARWTGTTWDIRGSIESDNNYDSGALYIEPDGCWRIIGPTEPGPQRYNTGGEIVMWTSEDEGNTWTKIKQLTTHSRYNHTYCRKPLNADPDFYCLWADGDGRKPSPSRLFFCDKQGHVYQLPTQMKTDRAKPVAFNGEIRANNRSSH